MTNGDKIREILAVSLTDETLAAVMDAINTVAYANEANMQEFRDMAMLDDEYPEPPPV